MRGKRVTIRTLDVGGDKNLPYLGQIKEDNPFLGCRGIRFSLQAEDMFRLHLRAVLRASAYGKAQLLLPMVSSVEEVRQAREIFEEEKNALRRRQIPFDEELPLGVMVETVAACLMADAFSKVADFFSLGTNDLTQYVLGVDRGNARVAQLYSYFHPALLRLIRRVLSVARENNIPVSICGEAAADTALTPVLLAFGLKKFSVAPVALLPVRKAISLWTQEEAAAVTEKAMALETEEEVRQFLLKQEKK
ncbi:phosphoenolpyruvate-protein phosphotransferase [Clostridium sp. CAG:1013]|nr:phosphoenolpyruvate-protein phosphotransferase [Clostridium sp. CAG:1013]